MTVFLNGEFLPLADARVPVLDRGFIFGDGVYEVIPVYSRKPFRLQEHLLRLQHSMSAIRLSNPYSDAQWQHIIQQLIEAHDQQDQSIYLHVTRGVARRDHAFPKPDVPPTVFMMSSPLSTPERSWVEQGVSCITATDNRWLRCDIKSIALLPNVLLRQAAVDAGCVEALLVRDSGYITEGSASNLFVVQDGCLLAPPKNNLMLPGITYDVVLELAARAGIPSQVRDIAIEEVRQADELLLTSSTKEVLAVTTLDDKPVGEGRPGAMFKRVYSLYQEFKQEIKRQ